MTYYLNKDLYDKDYKHVVLNTLYTPDTIYVTSETNNSWSFIHKATYLEQCLNLMLSLDNIVMYRAIWYGLFIYFLYFEYSFVELKKDYRVIFVILVASSCDYVISIF